MINSKNITTISIILLIIGFIASFFYNYDHVSYEDTLFNNDFVHKINIIVDENIWDNYIKKNKEKKENLSHKHENINCDIIIDGKLIKNISIKIKGGSTFDCIAESENTNKFSFKIDINQYIKNQNYNGLDSFTLNNLILDQSYMENHLSYNMFRHIGIPAPLTSYTELYINDDYYSLYLIIENIETSFLKRNNLYGNAIYKPYYDINLHKDNLTYYASDLIYRGNNLDHYQGLFNDEITKTSLKSRKELINIIKNINNGNLENSININNVIKYFAINNLINNEDGYLSNDPHNYYISQSQNKISILPWDYDASLNFNKNIVFEEILNKPNYTTYSINERPLWKGIIENEEYKNLYFSYLKEFSKTYIESGKLKNDIDKITNIIDPFIKKDALFQETKYENSEIHYQQYKESINNIYNKFLEFPEYINNK